MKKLKKSLLVVPALGVLMLAAAGSVGGTVAWFSSVSTFETNVSSFSVGRIAGNLDVTMTAVPTKGTISAGTNVVAVGKAAVGDVMMTHGSFNHAIELGDDSVYTVSRQEITLGSGTFAGRVSIDRTKFLYASKQIAGTYTFQFDNTSKWDLAANGNVAKVDNIDPANLTSDWGIALTGTPAETNTIIITLANTYVADDDWMYSPDKLADNKYWFYAVSWQMTFTYDFGTDTTARNVYFDTTSSISRTTTTNGTGDEETWQGFRLAFHDGATRSVIWAPEQNTAGDIRYVTGVNTVSSYTDSASVAILNGHTPANCVANNAANGGIANDANPEAEPAVVATNRNYLLQLTSGVGHAKTIDCVAWFEGTDPNVVNRADLDTVAASLKFFCVPHSA